MHLGDFWLFLLFLFDTPQVRKLRFATANQPVWAAKPLFRATKKRWSSKSNVLPLLCRFCQKQTFSLGSGRYPYNPQDNNLDSRCHTWNKVQTLIKLSSIKVFAYSWWPEDIFSRPLSPKWKQYSKKKLVEKFWQEVFFFLKVWEKAVSEKKNITHW